MSPIGYKIQCTRPPHWKQKSQFYPKRKKLRRNLELENWDRTKSILGCMACRVSNVNCLRAYPPSTPRFSPKCHHQNPNSPPLLLNNHSFPPPPTLKPHLPKQVITRYVLSFLLFSINIISNGEYCAAVSVFTYQMMSCSVTLRRSFVTVKSHMATAEEMSISEDRMLVSPYFLISVNSIYFTVLLKLVFFFRYLCLHIHW